MSMNTNSFNSPNQETITPIIGDYIVSTPGTCNGESRIAGTRIKVRHVFNWVERLGMSVTEVVENYPQLTRSAVHAALAYYWSHVDEIEQAASEEDRLVAELKLKASPSLIAQKLAEKSQLNGSDNSVSP